MEKSEIKNKSVLKTLQLYLGSYEGKIYLVELDLKTKNVKSNFAFKVSENSLKTIILKDSHVFASGIDEIIHIFDMNKKQDKGSIVTYSGSVTNLQIVKNFLFASGDENIISIWRMSDFNLVHTLKGHKGGITNFIIHSSGKFCLSAAKDNSVIIWNLITGTKIIKYTFKNNLICNKIIFLKNQNLAVLLFDSEFWIFDLFKKSENYEEWIIKKVKVSTKILEAFTIDNQLYLIHSNSDLTVFKDIIENDNFSAISLERPEKKSEEDLDIRIKFTNKVKQNKLNLLNVVYTNNEIYIFDLNKIKKSVLELESKENAKKSFKKWTILDLKTQDRITCLNSNLI